MKYQGDNDWGEEVKTPIKLFKKTKSRVQLGQIILRKVNVL